MTAKAATAKARTDDTIVVCLRGDGADAIPARHMAVIQGHRRQDPR